MSWNIFRLLRKEVGGRSRPGGGGGANRNFSSLQSDVFPFRAELTTGGGGAVRNFRAPIHIFFPSSREPHFLMGVLNGRMASFKSQKQLAIRRRIAAL